MIRDLLKEKLQKALIEAGYSDIEPEVLASTNPKFGDYYSPVALKLAKAQPNQNVSDTAKSLQAKLTSDEKIYAVDIASNGLINFRVANEYFQLQIQKIIEEDKNFGKIDIGKNQKVQVEFISANPTGPLTLGNGRGAFSGDTLANCLAFAGFAVQREYYINDTGNQIKNLGASILKELGFGGENADELYQGDYIKEISAKIKNTIDIESYKNRPIEVGEKAARLIFDTYIKPSLEKMNIGFDNFVSEKRLHESGKVKATLDLLKKKNLTLEKEGAIWFSPKKASGPKIEETDRVLVRSEAGDKAPTYFLSDIAYHLDKFGRGFEKVINIWGADHAGYVPRMKLAMSELGFSGKLVIIITQLVRLVQNGEEVRVSKRAGRFITLDELIDETSLDVARFFFISHAPNTHMDFDLNLAKETSSKNPVFYVQYAHARCGSLLKKAQKEGFSLSSLSNLDTSLINEAEEIVLLKQLVRFPELVEDISRNFAVHLLPSYTIELADKFHRFYERVRVLGSKKETVLARLALINATKTLLRNSLQLMGISAPERME
ncbi:MAG: arginine--tRNA ligase [Candidatus Woykebacteria bacterium RBG_16_44_10]|uniref:Arginine--tRNA ligase n=1 Tax=Candidatus Woykebacteria bacterium RBG_16_44_10 TaxID=1802597 RepID=A0A1G1WDZ1_9BACT|nr:MAG: arginine--tRNA ligase [Candidatus Woykebacteria bacterium RBG_16_44_10]